MGLNENIEEIKNLLQEQNKVKEKKFKLPFGKKVGKSQRKKGYVTIVLLKANGAVDFRKVQVADQYFMEDGIPRLGTAEYHFQWKGNPLIILPEESVKPLSRIELFEKTMEDGSNIKGYKILMDAMKKEQVLPKKSMGGIWKWIIGIGLAAIIAYAFLG